MLLQAERGSAGTFNLTGPAEPLTMGGLLDAARRLLAPQARLQWVDEAFLLAQGVAPWTELPLWLPQGQWGLDQVDISRALASGLTCRPLAATLADTAAWAAAMAQAAAAGTAEGPPRPAVGLEAHREAALLAAWHGRPGAGGG
jgi:2'-hydroxyisoflavone reductase